MDDIELIELPKQYDGIVQAETKVTNSAFKVIYFRPLDEDRVTIPGLSIEITIRTGLIVDRCKYTFTLFMLSQRKKSAFISWRLSPRISDLTMARREYTALMSTTAIRATYGLCKIRYAAQTTRNG